MSDNTNLSGLSGDRQVSAFMVCFAEGTLLSTPSGQVPVEKLAIGDTVDYSVKSGVYDELGAIDEQISAGPVEQAAGFGQRRKLGGDQADFEGVLGHVSVSKSSNGSRPPVAVF